MQKKISILGCGWLGLPLAEALVQENYQVAGSTTTHEKLTLLARKNIQPFLLDLQAPVDQSTHAAFFESPVLIVNVPPKRNSGNDYAAQIRNLQQALLQTSVKKIVFISSTSVYATSSGPVTEISPLDLAASASLIQAEKIIAAPKNPWQTTIVRFAGLFGPDRQPGRFLSGKTNLPDPKAPVNLIHQHDCIQIIQEIIRQEKWGEIYNACADAHPSRQEFYPAAARKLNLPEPEFTPEMIPEKPVKLISSEKLKADLGYKFLFPDPLQALETTVENGIL